MMIEKIYENYDCIVHLATINNRKKYNRYSTKQNFKIFKVFEVAKLFNLFIIFPQHIL